MRHLLYLCLLLVLFSSLCPSVGHADFIPGFYLPQQEDTSSTDDSFDEPARYTGEEITLVFDSTPIRSVLQLIVDVSDMNILASSSVKGKVTLRLIDVPWDQALDLILDTTGLVKVQEGNILRIMTRDEVRVNEQTAATKDDVLETRVFPVHYATVNDMKNSLADIKSDRGRITADSRNKQLVVSDVAAVLEQMEEMVSNMDKSERQVIIEARFVEANTNFSRNLGVQWNLGDTDNDATGNKQFNVGSARTGSGGAFFVKPSIGSSGFGFAAVRGDLDIGLRLSDLENAGKGRIVSTPRVTTLDGEKAVISQSVTIPFATASDAGADVSFENAELKLQVTPMIMPDDSIILDIDVSNSVVGKFDTTAVGDSASTKILVKDGQTMVIGGLFVKYKEDPHGLPVIESLTGEDNYSNLNNKNGDYRELLIFLRPQIAER